MENDKGIVFDKMLDLKIQSAVTDELGQGIFDASDGHYFDHRTGQESDHLSSLLKGVVSVYLNMRLKIYGKKYTAEIAFGNKPSRHEMTKTILFMNQ